MYHQHCLIGSNFMTTKIIISVSLTLWFLWRICLSLWVLAFLAGSVCPSCPENEIFVDKLSLCTGTNENWIYRIIESNVLKAEYLQIGTGFDLSRGGKLWMAHHGASAHYDITNFLKDQCYDQYDMRVLITHQTSPASLITFKVDVPQWKLSHFWKSGSRF